MTLKYGQSRLAVDDSCHFVLRVVVLCFVRWHSICPKNPSLDTRRKRGEGRDRWKKIAAENSFSFHSSVIGTSGNRDK